MDDRLKAENPVAPPWRIGWFGALRCRRSLELLADFTRRQGGRFEVVLRGRPALSEFPDFHAFVEAEPYLSFRGPYRNPEDMAAIYGEVHFSWAIDFFEEGQNSEWLLPNRLYEGCRFGAVPISMGNTETGRFLNQQDIGVLLVRGHARDARSRARPHGRGSLRQGEGARAGPQSEDVELRPQRLPGALSTGCAVWRPCPVRSPPRHWHKDGQ